MALVTVHAVVYIPVHALVMPVGIGLISMFMATQTRENQIVLRIRVARIARGRPAVCLREPRVVEGCTQPACRRVASLAGVREARRGVVRIRRVVVIRLVAAYASRIRDLVVAIDVALRAGH